MTTLALKCVEFNGNLTAGLLSMFESEQYANVTIAVEGKYLKAHQMVLSICSPYFDALLQTNPSKHPIIFMKNVKFNIMQPLLRFMYEGQTEVAAEDFELFIETAQELQVKWLTRCHTQNAEETCVNTANTSAAGRAAKRPRRSRTRETNTNQLDIHAIDQEPINQSPPSDSIATRSSGTQLKIEVEEDNRQLNQEEMMTTTCESLENTNVNTNMTIAECTTNTDTGRFFVEPIDKALDAEQINYLEGGGHKSPQGAKLEEQVEIIDLADEHENDELWQTIDEAPNMSLQPSSTHTSQKGKPVHVVYYNEDNRVQLRINKYSYAKSYVSKAWNTWRCALANSHKCRAKIMLTKHDQRIVFRHQHCHEPEIEKVKSWERIKKEIYYSSAIIYKNRKGYFK